MEKEAHEFAANLLMPGMALISCSAHASLDQILSAKRYFGLRLWLLAYRAHALGKSHRLGVSLSARHSAPVAIVRT